MEHIPSSTLAVLHTIYTYAQYICEQVYVFIQIYVYTALVQHVSCLGIRHPGMSACVFMCIWCICMCMYIMHMHSCECSRRGRWMNMVEIPAYASSHLPVIVYVSATRLWTRLGLCVGVCVYRTSQQNRVFFFAVTIVVCLAKLITLE